MPAAPSDASDLRATVLAALEAVSGWTESRHAPELFGRDSDNMMHKAFVVGVPETVPHSREGRQVAAQGMYAESVVEVQWAYRLRGDAQSTDYSAALDAELVVVATVKGVADANVMVERLSRRAVAEGWVLGVSRFRVLHRYRLTVV